MHIKYKYTHTYIYVCIVFSFKTHCNKTLISWQKRLIYYDDLFFNFIHLYIRVSISSVAKVCTKTANRVAHYSIRVIGIRFILYNQADHNVTNRNRSINLTRQTKRERMIEYNKRLN